MKNGNAPVQKWSMNYSKAAYVEQCGTRRCQAFHVERMQHGRAEIIEPTQFSYAQSLIF